MYLLYVLIYGYVYNDNALKRVYSLFTICKKFYFVNRVDLAIRILYTCYVNTLQILYVLNDSFLTVYHK